MDEDKFTISQTVVMWIALILILLFGLTVLTLLIYLSVEMWQAILN